MIVETCPECGHDLQTLVLTSLPPVHVWSCPKCGWRHEEREEIIRLPFNRTSHVSTVLNTGTDHVDPKISTQI